MNTKIWTLLLIVYICCFGEACRHKSKKHLDKFYSKGVDFGDWDEGRVPLLKPYEMVITNKESGWSMNLQGLDGDTGFSGIQQVNVVDSLILVSNINSFLHGASAKQSWHVIIPEKHIEKGFLYYSEYLNYLHALGFKGNPKLYNAEDVANYFDSHDVMDWQDFNRLQLHE